MVDCMVSQEACSMLLAEHIARLLKLFILSSGVPPQWKTSTIVSVVSKVLYPSEEVDY